MSKFLICMFVCLFEMRKHRMICATVMISTGVYSTFGPILRCFTHTHSTSTQNRSFASAEQPFASPENLLICTSMTKVRHICWFSKFIDMIFSKWEWENGFRSMANKMLIIWEFMFHFFVWKYDMIFSLWVSTESEINSENKREFGTAAYIL